MTVKDLIAELSKLNPDAPVELEVVEPYDDDPAVINDEADRIEVDSATGIVVICGSRDDMKPRHNAVTALFDPDRQ